MSAAERAELEEGAIGAAISAYVRRRRWRAVVAAIGWGLASWMLWEGLWMGVDRRWALPQWARGVVLVVGVMGAVAIIALPMARLLFGSVPWLAAAVEMEGADGRCEGALATWVSQAMEEPTVRGSGALLAEVGAMVERTLDRGARSEKWTPGQWAGWAVVVSGVALGALAGRVAPRPWHGLMMRAMEPWEARAPVTRVQLSVSPGTVRVAAGEAVEFVVEADGLKEGQPVLRWKIDGGLWTSVLMRAEGGRFVYRLAAVDQSIDYEISAGDARSAIYRVQLANP